MKKSIFAPMRAMPVLTRQKMIAAGHKPLGGGNHA